MNQDYRYMSFYRTFFVSALALSFNLCFLFAQNTTDNTAKDRLARDGFIWIGDFDFHKTMRYETERRNCTTCVRAFRYKNDEELSYIINDHGFDGAGIVVFPKDQSAFLNALNFILKKYVEWSVIAKENSITDYKKDIPIDIPAEGYWMAVGLGQLTLDEKTGRYNLWAIFNVDAEGIPFVSVGYNDVSTKYPYDVHAYDFFSADEIEKFINILEPNNFTKIYNDVYAKLKAEDRDSLFN